MADTIRTPRPLLAALTALAIFGSAGRTRAQDEDDLAPEEAAAPVVQNVFMVDDSNFDQWVFNGVGNAAAGRNRLDAMLTLKVDEVDRACKLTDGQKAKLRLLGRGDVKRLYERVEEKRKAFQLVKTDQQKLQQFYQEIPPLVAAFQSGPFDDSSFFTRGVRKALDGGQVARYEAAQAERRAFRYRAKLDLAATMIDNSVGLTSDQRRKLRVLLEKETWAPKTFGPYDYYVVIYQLSRLPEGRLRPIFNDAQWGLFGPQLAQAKRMEPTLLKSGVLPDEPGEPAANARPEK